MTITRHLSEATLMSYAAGALPSALAGVAAAHAAVCAHCRREIASLESIGAALVDSLPPVALKHPEPSQPVVVAVASPPQTNASAEDVPQPLARLIGERLGAIRWRWLGPGMWHSRLPLDGAGDMRLLKLAPGRHLPKHGHSGSELTLVLSGGFHDETGRYARGDVADLDEDMEHRPVADAEAGCVCLVACEQPLQFHGFLPRLLRPFHGF